MSLALYWAIVPLVFCLILKTHLEPNAFRLGRISLTVSHVPFLAKESSSEAIASSHHSASGEANASVYNDGSLEVIIVDDTIIAFSAFIWIQFAEASRCSTWSSDSHVDSSMSKPAQCTL